jgi:Mn-dependent DtxR family transcriptional regulator
MSARSKTPATPTTLDEFIFGWDGWIDGAIEKVSKGNVLRGTPIAEDVKQQVYYRIIQQGHIEKFDVSKGSFSHHIYRVVLHVMSNMWDKNTRTPTANAIPVVESVGDDQELQGVLVLDRFEALQEESHARLIETREMLDKFEDFVAENSEPWGELVQMPDGSSRQRSLLLVYRLMRQEMEPKEIAKILRVTGGSVFGYIKKLKALASDFQKLTLSL